MNGSGQRSFFIFYVLGTLLVLAIAGGVYYVWQGKQKREAEEARGRAAALEAGPSVTVAAAARGPNLRKLLLVGEALPYNTTTLYSKVSGYLAKITVDVGDRVKAGQLIAEIQSPEIDQQIETATVALDNKRRVLPAQRAIWQPRASSPSRRWTPRRPTSKSPRASSPSCAP